jgi:3'-5' exoribonuclease
MQVKRIFMVKKLDVRTAKNNAPYLDIVLFDKYNEISAKLWDTAKVDVESLKGTLFLLVSGGVETYNGRLQLRLDSVCVANPTNEELDKLIEQPPYPKEEMYDEIIMTLKSITNEDIRRLCLSLYEKHREGLLSMPAAKTFHHTMISGLLFHTYSMMKSAKLLLTVYTFLNRDLVLAGVALHDIGKVLELTTTEFGTVSDYSKEGRLLGHLISGICEVEKEGWALGCDEEVILLIKHMILSHHGLPEYGSPRVPLIAEAEMLHMLDMIDSKLYMFEKAISQTAEHEFSQKIYSLESREIYNHSFENPEGDNI